MSEILRAILDANCVDSRTAFYCASLSYAVPSTGAITFGDRRASIACKSDTWFLCQGAAMETGFFVPGGPYDWDNRGGQALFQIKRANNGEVFSNTMLPRTLANDNLSHFAQLDEYILFAPAELILIEERVAVTTSNPSPGTRYAFVTLQGIEYQLPAGMRIPGYGAT